MFKEYSDFEYVCIHTANQFGKDKLLFEERIEWTVNNINNLRKLLPEADDYHQAYKATMVMNKILKGIPTGVRIGLDACSQGTQILSVMSACIQSAAKVGLVDPNKRCDVYTDVINFINAYLPKDKHIRRGGNIDRDALKDAFMTYL